MRVDVGFLGPLASHDAIFFLPFPGPEDLQMIKNQILKSMRNGEGHVQRKCTSNRATMIK